MFIEELLDYLPFHKVFEICVRKQVSLALIFSSNNSKEYNNHLFEDYRLSDKEFNAIKGLACYMMSII